MIIAKLMHTMGDDSHPVAEELMATAIEGKYGIITAEKKQFHPGEPVFLLRATDKLAPASVREYAQRCFNAGCSGEHIEAARHHADRIEAWQREHPELVKTPD